MGYYDLTKDQRELLFSEIAGHIISDLVDGKPERFCHYFDDEDTYIRKAAYLSIGRIFLQRPDLHKPILETLAFFLKDERFRVRQTAINAAGEIGKIQFEIVQQFFDTALFDTHHSPRNAVIGSIKKMSEVNPVPVLNWARNYLQHPQMEIRREICHGIELRGRKFPQDILPLLQELENDQTARVRNTLVHVLGQIAYKKGCLETVIAHLKNWTNKTLVTDAIEEIIDVHHRYRNFSVLTQNQAREYIRLQGLIPDPERV